MEGRRRRAFLARRLFAITWRTLEFFQYAFSLTANGLADRRPAHVFSAPKGLVRQRPPAAPSFLTGTPEYRPDRLALGRPAAGNNFDPDILQAFKRCAKAFREIFETVAS